jgi:hypothetical protein
MLCRRVLKVADGIAVERHYKEAHAMPSRIEIAFRARRIGAASLACAAVILARSVPSFGQLQVQADPAITTAVLSGRILSFHDGIRDTISNPNGVAVDQDGNIPNDAVWQWSQKYHTFRRVAGSQQSGYGGDGGPAVQTKLNSPYGVAVDTAGNIYIADEQNMRIRRVDTNGIITTIAGGGDRGGGYNGDNRPATSLTLCAPTRIAVSTDGTLYISEECNNLVRKVVAGVLETVAGTPPAVPFSPWFPA